MITILLCGSAMAVPVKRDSLVVSLVTVWPGSEVYELDGHSALRIRSAGKDRQRQGVSAFPMDSVWNYGLFDFNTPNFVYRFVKGETDYMVGGYPFAYFMPEYYVNRRRVIEQDLNLTQDEAWRLLGLLRTESMPQNCVYRYNYVLNNCATRITDRIGDAVGGKILFPDTLSYGTYRREMRAYHKNYSWYQFGIDLALGSGLDRPLRPNDEMFSPMVMSERYAGGVLPDGRPLVRDTRVLNEGSPDAVLPPTPWYLTPNFWSAVVFILAVLLTVWMAVKKRIFRWIYTLWFLLTGLTGCLVTFLVFVSTHEATSPNLLILWLNPLQLIIAIGVWSRKMKRVTLGMSWLNIITLGVLLLAWPFQSQSASPAVFPLMGATMLLSVAYAIIAHGESYNKRNKNVSRNKIPQKNKKKTLK